MSFFLFKSYDYISMLVINYSALFSNAHVIFLEACGK